MNGAAEAVVIQPKADGFHIPDAAALTRTVLAALTGAADARAARALVVQELLAVRAKVTPAFEAAFLGSPRTARQLIAAQAGLTDVLVQVTLAAALHLHPLPNPTEAERIAVLAVGGYGRTEMAPQSDVDLLFLTPWKITP